MIKDRLVNAKTYYKLSENLKKGFEWLMKNDMENIACGKYEIDGDVIYANVQEYETKTEAKYESHKKYIDIQYMIKGKEFVGVTDITNCFSCVPYDDQKDLEFFDIKTKDEYQTLNEGEFLVLYPHDAHKPSIAYDEKSFVKKVVIKVAID